MGLIDTHTHIYYEDYRDNLDEIISNALDEGVEKIITVGVDLKSSEECLTISEKYEPVFATCGYHPHEAKKAPPRYLYELEQLYKYSKVVAVGEIGLDYHYNFSEPEIQKKIYLEQLEMAKSLEFPAVVHCRDADEDVLKGILESGHESGVIHCFASDLEFANKILDTGFHLSFTGMITFIKDLEEVVQEIPLKKMMVETDSPYLTPKPNRGKQNQPANVKFVAEKIAEIKMISLEKVTESTTKTAHNLFKKLRAESL